MKVKAVLFSQMLVLNYNFTRRHNPEDQTWTCSSTRISFTRELKFEINILVVSKAFLWNRICMYVDAFIILRLVPNKMTEHTKY
jgi:hypothetical protein